MSAPFQAFADRLRKARAHLGLSQADLAAKMSVVVRPYQDFEAGKRLPKGEGLFALAEAGIDTNWLLTGVGQMLRDAPPAPAAELDEQLLAEAIRIVEAWLAQRDLVLAADRKAKAVAAIYALAVDDAADGRAFDPRRAAHVLKLVG